MNYTYGAVLDSLSYFKHITVFIECFLRSIMCKGLSYSLVHPKPVMSMLSLKLPLCELNSEKAQFEVGGREGRRKGGETECRGR